MSSVVDICNIALARLGDSAAVTSIDPPEGSMQAEQCARFYPIALDSLLEAHDWRFATRRVPLALLDMESFEWQFAYAHPAGVIKILSVTPRTAKTDAMSEPYITETGESGDVMILTDVQDASVRFTVRVTDTTKFSPLFVDALSWLLASHLAGPVIKGDAGAAAARSCYAMYRALLGQASVSDANQQRTEPDHTPGWIQGR